MDKKPERLVPEVRFKGFTDDWEQRKFDNVVKRINDKDDNPELPHIEFENIISGNGTLNKNIKNLNSKKIGTKFQKEDILFGKLRPYLKNWYFAKENGIAVGDFWVLRAKKISVFVYYLIQTEKFYSIANLSSGSKMPRSDWNLVSNSRFNFPENTIESIKIGNLILQFDKLITLQQRKLEQLKQLKKAMLQYLLTTEKKSAPLIRNKNYNNKWDTTTFSKLLNYERPENYIVTNTNYRKNGIPVLTANKSFILGYTNESNVYNKGEAIIFDDFTLENKFVNFPFMIKSSAIKILTSKVNYSLYFIFQLLQHTKFIKEGHARHYISVVQKQTVRIPPSYEEQESISDTFSRIQSLIKLQQNKIDQYTTLKKYLLQKIFI